MSNKKGKALAVHTGESSKQEGCCFHCGEASHWKQDYPQFKANGAADTVQLVSKTNCSMSVFSTSWILDYGVGAHVCIMILDELERESGVNDR